MQFDPVKNAIKRAPGSLRDPAGFIFELDENLYRTVNHNHKLNLDFLLASGLYKQLLEREYMIPHETASGEFDLTELNLYHIFKVKKLPFISYPYEWCFEQLKTAALFTLDLQKIALDNGMTLKDASALNVQYQGIKPIFIDILSLEIYEEGTPWLAYEQFCRHFLAPLALMSYSDDRLQQLLRIYLDGIPLDLASELLPLKSQLNISLFVNLFVQAKAQKWFSRSNEKTKPIVQKYALIALIDNLRNLISELKIKKRHTAWNNYYEDACIYTEQGMNSKERAINGLLEKTKAKIVWDIGANDGRFSRIASAKAIYTISMDSDHASVDRSYLRSQMNSDFNLLPLLMDAVNPSPAQGWSNCETKSLTDRGPADTMLALALIHHLAITHNLSLASIAACFAAMCKTLIVEFVPQNDPQVLFLLESKPTPFFDQKYNIKVFEQDFEKYFVLSETIKIEDSGRIIYFCHRR